MDVSAISAIGEGLLNDKQVDDPVVPDSLDGPLYPNASRRFQQVVQKQEVDAEASSLMQTLAELSPGYAQAPMLLADGLAPRGSDSGTETSYCSLNHAPMIIGGDSPPADISIWGTIVMGFMPSATGCQSSGVMFPGYDQGARHAVFDSEKADIPISGAFLFQETVEDPTKLKTQIGLDMFIGSCSIDPDIMYKSYLNDTPGIKWSCGYTIRITSP